MSAVEITPILCLQISFLKTYFVSLSFHLKGFFHFQSTHVKLAQPGGNLKPGSGVSEVKTKDKAVFQKNLC